MMSLAWRASRQRILAKSAKRPVATWATVTSGIFSNAEMTDIVGNPCPSILDSEATIVHTDNRSVVLYVWYDNEYGYTRQVLRLSKHFAGVEGLKYY